MEKQLYMKELNDSLDRCLENTRSRFNHLEIVDRIVYLPSIDQRVYRPFGQDVLMLPGDALITSDLEKYFLKEEKFATGVKVFPFAMTSNSLVIQVEIDDYTEKGKNNGLTIGDNFTVYSPDVNYSSLQSGKVIYEELPAIIFSTNDADMLYDEIPLKNLSDNNKVKEIYKMIDSIDSGCQYTEAVANTVKLNLKADNSSALDAALLELTILLEMSDKKELFLSFIESEEPELRKLSYIGLSQLKSEDSWGILLKALKKETDIEVRYSLLRNLIKCGIVNGSELRDVLSKIELSRKESRLMKKIFFKDVVMNVQCPVRTVQIKI